MGDTASDNELLAKQANAYARKHILEGTTQLQNNFYENNKKSALKKALEEIRSLARVPFFSNIYSSLMKFEQRIKDCKKFSIGNCYELALMGLDYMIRENPEINAEVYQILGGDHVILVIG